VKKYITGGEEEENEEWKRGVLMTRTGTKWLRADNVFLKRHSSSIDPRESKLFQFYRFLSTYFCRAFK
jgi:hypothetical protein